MAMSGAVHADDIRLNGMAGDDMDIPDINFNSEGGYAIQFVRYNRANSKFEIMPEAVEVAHPDVVTC
jgi:hypothetical protein